MFRAWSGVTNRIDPARAWNEDVVLVTQPHLNEGEAKLSHSCNKSLHINCLVINVFLYALSDFHENFPLPR